MRRPPPVRSGDLVGIAAVSSTPDATALARGVERLHALGFQTRLADNVASTWCGMAGSDQERVDGLHRLAEDPEVRAIFFARGGHGVLRLLPLLDWGLLAAHPRAYVGYSDLTPLLLQIVDRLGLISFHGPMVATDLARGLEQDEQDSLLAELSGDGSRTLPCHVSASHTVEGRLLGGCLSLLTALVGTPFFPDLGGGLLFVEDTNEPFYRLDRMLTHLLLSGNLNRVKGMILGHLEPTDGSLCGPERESARIELDRAGVPLVAVGLASGHGRPNWTLPLGAQVRVDPQAGGLVSAEI